MEVPKIVKDAWKFGKNTVLNVPEIERKVKEATSNEKWGPSGTQMREIAQATNSYNDLPIIMQTIWRRLNDHGKYWRHVYKSLLLIDYLLKNGSDKVIKECRSNIIQIQTLMEFQHIDENDKDVGLNVRERAKQIVELLHDEKRLRSEREKAKVNAKKFMVSMGSDSGWGSSSHSNFDYEDDKEDDFPKKKTSHYDSDDEEHETEFEEHEKKKNVEDNEEFEEKEKFSNIKKNISSSSSSSSSKTPSSDSKNNRPRAPSLEKSTNKPISQPNLFDIDDTSNISSNKLKETEFDFFNTPINSSSTAPFQSLNNTSNNINPFSISSKNNMSNDFFDPRGSSTTSSEWVDFQGTSNNKNSTSSPIEENIQQKEKSVNDLWNMKNLVNLDLTNKNSTSTTQITSANKVPMGALAKQSSTIKPTNTMGMNSMSGTTIGMNSMTGTTMGINPMMMGNTGTTMNMNPMMMSNTGTTIGMNSIPGTTMGINSMMMGNTGTTTMNMNPMMMSNTGKAMGINSMTGTTTMNMNPMMMGNTGTAIGMNSTPGTTMGINPMMMGNTGTTINMNPMMMGNTGINNSKQINPNWP